MHASALEQITDLSKNLERNVEMRYLQERLGFIGITKLALSTHNVCRPVAVQSQLHDRGLTRYL